MMQVAVSQYLFVCYNVYRSNMMLAHEIRLTDWESFCPLVAVPDDKWIDILVGFSSQRCSLAHVACMHTGLSGLQAIDE